MPQKLLFQTTLEEHLNI